MTDDTKRELDNLRLAINNLTARLTDFAIRGEAARLLLVKHGVFSDEEYAEKLASLRSHWLAVLDEKIVEKKTQEAQTLETQLRQFLESFEGPKQ